MTAPTAPTTITPRSFIGSAGNRLAADEAGPADGPPLLLLHGGGQTRHSWHRALAELGAKGWHAIALDTRGHGDSEWPADGDYEVGALADDLRAVLRVLDRPPVLVGASLGGVTSLVAEGETPGLARALVLVDVVPRIETEGMQRIAGFMTARPDGFASLEEAADMVAAYNPSRPRPRDPAGLVKNLRQREDGRWVWHWDPRFMTEDRSARVSRLQTRMLAAAGHVRVPTLLLRGQHSDIVSPEGVAELRAHLPQLEYVDVQGASHMVAGDRNDRFNAELFDFLERHVPLGR